jgi:hypothetical protein
MLVLDREHSFFQILKPADKKKTMYGGLLERPITPQMGNPKGKM